MAHDVFVSYARENTDAANAIVDLLQDMGISCWIDEKLTHQHGDDWAAAIVSAIKGSRLMVVVFSQHANASTYVRKEVGLAVNAGLPIIPFRIEDFAPQGSLDLHLADSQWLDAFPLFERHLDTLATSVCRKLDGGKSPPAANSDRSPKVGWRRFMTAHVDHLRRSVLTSSKSERPRTAPETPAQVSSTYGARKAAREAASKEDVRVLAKANRWWRIKEIIETLETQGVPLGQYADAKKALEKRLVAFQRDREAAEEAITKLGPAKAEPHLQKLQELVADHPDIDALNIRRKEMLQDRIRLQKSVDAFVTDNRWTAVENTIRSFAIKHCQATQSLLQAAEKASSRALEETRRFDLLMWTIFAGAIIIGACYCVESWLGISDGSFAYRFSGATEQLLIPVFSALVRFGTVVTATGFVLALFGVRHQGTFAGASVALMTVAAGAQVLPWASSFVPWHNGAPPKEFDIAVSWLPCAVFAITLMMAIQFATSLLIGVRPAWPGQSATLAATLAGYGFLPERGITDTYLGQWSRWVPDALLCASLLAASGTIDRKRWWWLMPLFAVGVGVLGPSSSWSEYDALWKRTAPVIIVLLVAGWIAARPTTLRGYLILFSAACCSCYTAEYLRGINVRSGMLPYGRLAPLMSIWAIACGSVAIRHKKILSPWVRGWDTILKQLLRIRGAAAQVHQRQLADSEWYRQGREWHSSRAVGTKPQMPLGKALPSPMKASKPPRST